jgi:hypothetical protein
MPTIVASEHQSFAIADVATVAMSSFVGGGQEAVIV